MARIVHRTDHRFAARAPLRAKLRRIRGRTIGGRDHRPETSVLARLRNISFQMGPALRDVLTFTEELAVMIQAGISINSAIGGIAEQIKNRKFRKIITQIKTELEAGSSFSEALGKHPNIFPPLYINMVSASELSGNFGETLDRIAGYLDHRIHTRSMVLGAMIYPSIIALMAVTTSVFLLTFVLPKFIALFAGKEHLLPVPTKILIAASDFMRTYWYALLAGAIAVAVALRFAINTPAGREYSDKIKLRLPLFKRMFRALYITHGMHAMSDLVAAGVPILETLRLTADISGNTVYKRMWLSIGEGVQRGQKIVTTMTEESLLPANVVQMIAAGEESGSLAKILKKIADYYSRDLKKTIKAVTTMLEPLMIIIMGLIVGFVALSIVLPMFKISSQLK